MMTIKPNQNTKSVDIRKVFSRGKFRVSLNKKLVLNPKLILMDKKWVKLYALGTSKSTRLRIKI